MNFSDDRDRRIADELAALREPFPGRIDVRARVLREIADDRAASGALRPSRHAWIAAVVAIAALAAAVLARGAEVVGDNASGISQAPGLARAALVVADGLGSALTTFVGALGGVAMDVAELGFVAALEATPFVAPAVHGVLLATLAGAVGWALRDARRRARAEGEGH